MITIVVKDNLTKKEQNTVNSSLKTIKKHLDNMRLEYQVQKGWSEKDLLYWINKGKCLVKDCKNDGWVVEMTAEEQLEFFTDNPKTLKNLVIYDISQNKILLEKATEDSLGLFVDSNRRYLERMHYLSSTLSFA